MNRWIRFGGSVLAVMMAAAPLYTAAAERTEGYTYQVMEDGSACITRCTSGGKVVVPDTLDGHPVTGIREQAFKGNDELVSVVFPEGILSVGEYAFWGCSNLKEVSFPASLQELGRDPFEFCSSLQSFRVDKNNEKFEAKNGVLFDKSESTLLYFPYGRSGSYTVPEGTLHIGDYAFITAPVSSVSLPKSLQTIGNNAFHSCDKLKGALKIPANVTSIGEGAFSLCGYTSLTVPESVTSIGPKAFMGCMIKTLKVADGNPAYQAVDDVLFTADGKTLVYYPGGLEGEAYTVPEGTERIESGAFYFVPQLRYLFISEGVKSLGDFVVYVCYNLQYVKVPATLEKVGKSSLQHPNHKLVIGVPADSYMEEWCKTHHLVFMEKLYQETENSY